MDSKPTTGDTKNSAVQSVRQQLIPKANLIALVDLPGIAHKVLSLVVASETIPIPLTPEALENLKAESSYLGFSMATEPQALHCKTVVPVQQIQGIFKLVTFAMRMAAQQQQF